MTYKIKIYKIVNTINNDIYVGSTKNELRVRWQGHRNDAKRYPERNGLHEMIATYGTDKFRIILIEEIEVKNKEQQLQHEQKFIDELKPVLNMNAVFKKKRTIEEKEEINRLKEERYANSAKSFKLTFGSVWEGGKKFVFAYSRNKERTFERLNSRDEAETRQKVVSLMIAKEKYNDVCCPVCKVGLSPYSFMKHLLSKKHLENYEVSENIKAKQFVDTFKKIN